MAQPVTNAEKTTTGLYIMIGLAKQTQIRIQEQRLSKVNSKAPQLRRMATSKEMVCTRKQS